MTIPFRRGRYAARFAQNAADITACQRLRHETFMCAEGVEADAFDQSCRHLMVEDESGHLAACARLFDMRTAGDLKTGYVAQFYDLSGLAQISQPMLELGRFCTAVGVQDVDVLRIAWGALTQFVDQHGITMLFGCTSFKGTNPAPFGRVFERLASRHVGPDRLRPNATATEVIAFNEIAPDGSVPMPSLLRSYLAMGGWVGDQVVVDRMMNTMHIFTCVEVANVPPNRAGALRALAQTAPLS